MANNIVMSVHDLWVAFDVNGKPLKALRGVSVEVHSQECLVIVGESGSGKSVLCKSCMGLLDDNGSYLSGRILYQGENLAAFRNQKQWQAVRRGNLGMIMQNPQASLNPLRSIGGQIMEAFLLHGKLSRKAAKQHTLDMLADAGFSSPDRAFKLYPHELSGGMCQRVCIAMAVAAKPKILFLDEPTSSLDVIRQAQILEYINRLRRKHKLTLVFVTHDLGVAARMADRIAVMYAGEVVEIGTAEEIFFDPKHPYTWSLLASIPQLAGHDHMGLRGAAPDLTKPVVGDPFAPRNPWALEIDFHCPPPYFHVSATHKAKTWLLDPRSAVVSPPEAVRRLKTLTEHTQFHFEHHGKEGEGLTGEPLIRIRDLEVVYRRGRKRFRAVENVSLDIMPGEIFGLVGESGSGKTTIGNVIMGLVPPSKGTVLINGCPRDKQQLQQAQMIFQDPVSSVNSRAKINDIVREGLRNLYPQMSKNEQHTRVLQALADVGLGPERGDQFPHALSGGQLQRVGIARAVIMQPKLIIADEPVSALDVSLRAQILQLLLQLREKHRLTYLLIAHDLSVMGLICDRIGVIKAGRLVELGKTEQIYADPRHPYTKSLLSAIPVPNPTIEKSRTYYFCEEGPPEGRWTQVQPGHFVLQEPEL